MFFLFLSIFFLLNKYKINKKKIIIKLSIFLKCSYVLFHFYRKNNYEIINNKGKEEKNLTLFRLINNVQ